MERPTIKSPVSSYESARMQIQAGADEIYLGFLSDKIQNLTFSGRGKESYNKTPTHMNYQEFKKIIEFAHAHRVVVELAANMPMIGDDIDGKDTFQKNYIEYVKEAIDAGVDRVICGDIGNMINLRESGITIPITASCFLAAMNHYEINMLEELGADKICLPHHFTFPELKSIVKNSKARIEVFCHFGCSFLEGTCSLYHAANEEINFGLPCRGKYRINNECQEETILDTGEDCSLCNLPQICEAGISSVKIIGRDMDPKLTSTITFVYKYAMKQLDAGKEMDQILAEIKQKFDFKFWEEGFCKLNRCKYMNTEYYI